MSINVQTEEGHQSQPTDIPTGVLSRLGHVTIAFSADEEREVCEGKGDCSKNGLALNNVLVL